jgi:cellulose synthase/poly-beta-1,6-N-acetylglucosamine synthase-like glycosyltransferase
MSILIPCYNEQDAVEVSVKGLLQVDYHSYEVIFINDGSSDATMQAFNNLLDLEWIPNSPKGLKAVYRSRRYTHIWVLDQRNRGKSAALNAGMLFAKNNIIVTLDADSLLERDALKVLSHTFADKNVAAAGGAIHIMQGYSCFGRRYRLTRMTPIIALQLLEYLKGFYVYKLSLAKQNAIAIVSGAFGAFRKDLLEQAGGYRHTLGEDIDITMRIQRMIHKTQKKVVYVPQALCYTQCPETWRDLRRQRIRWQKGFIDCAVYHKRFLLKTFLTKALSFHFFVEALLVGICSCVFTVLSFAALLLTDRSDVMIMFVIYQMISILLAILYSLCAVYISSRYHSYPKGSWPMILLALGLDILFYRWLTIFWYLGGTLAYFWSCCSRKDWNKVARSKKDFIIGSGV